MAEHVDITDPEIHEPKGASTATANQVYSADGAGSGTWQKVKNVNLYGVSATPVAGWFVVSDGSGGFSFAPAAHGSTKFVDYTTPYSLAATTSYAKVAATTIAGGSPTNFTEGTNARLTYTGTVSSDLDFVIAVIADQSTGSGKDIYVALYKNGTAVPYTETAVTTVSGSKLQISVHTDVTAAQNDYFEIYCKISSAATVNFYSVQLFASTAGA
jgi:hypothetical protein